MLKNTDPNIGSKVEEPIPKYYVSIPLLKMCRRNAPVGCLPTSMVASSLSILKQKFKASFGVQNSLHGSLDLGQSLLPH